MLAAFLPTTKAGTGAALATAFPGLPLMLTMPATSPALLAIVWFTKVAPLPMPMIFRLANVRRLSPKPDKILVCHGDAYKALDLASSIYRSYKIETKTPMNLETTRLQ